MTSIIKVNTIQDVGGNNLLISNGSGTITTNNIGGQNTPSFQANLSSDANISNLTDTKVLCNTEVYDSDGCYDNSTNYRFTPTKAGKYMIYGQVDMYSGANSDLFVHVVKFYKNGSQHTFKYQEYRNNPLKTITTSMSCIIDFNGSSDYVELYAQIEEGSSSSQSLIQGYQARTHFGGYRIIGA